MAEESPKIEEKQKETEQTQIFPTGTEDSLISGPEATLGHLVKQEEPETQEDRTPSETPEKKEVEPEIRPLEEKIFTSEFIKEKVIKLLQSLNNVKEIKKIEVKGSENNIELILSVVGKKGPVTIKNIDASALLETTNGKINLKNYQITASAFEGMVRELIVPKLKQVPDLIKLYIENEEGKKVKELEIINGELKVVFVEPASLKNEEKSSPETPEEKEASFLESVVREEEAKLENASPAQKEKITARIAKIKEKIAEKFKGKIKSPEKFTKEMDLELLVPLEFKNLDEAQKLKVVQDLKRRVVDIVKSDAQTQYSEFIKKEGVLGKISSSLLGKEFITASNERDSFNNIKGTEEGKKFLADNLKILVEKTREQKIYIGDDGRPKISFLVPPENPEEVGWKQEAVAIDDFNKAANAFAQMPYEWGQEKKHLLSGNKRKYEKAKDEYERTRGIVLGIKTKENPEEKSEKMLELLQIHNAIQMEQVMNTHPEFEKVLWDLSKEKNIGKETILGTGRTLKNMLNMVTGKNWTNRAIMATGYGARMLARGAALATGMTPLTYLGGVIVGGIMGGLRGKIRGKETLQERRKQARYGQKDTSAEKVLTTDADHLIKQLEKLINEVENAESDEQKSKKLASLATRIEHTQGKIEKGLVNFGNANSFVQNQYGLVNNLNKALVLKELNSEKINKNLKSEIDNLLSRIGGGIAEKTSEAQKKFINKQMLKGAAYGAGFATAGYVLRYVGEHLGWWGEQGAENIPPEKEITEVSESKIPTAPPAENVTPSPETTPEPASTETTPKTPPAELKIEPPEKIAIIGKGEGIEHAFRRQIEEDADLAKKLGYTGALSDKEELHKFSGGAAHHLAIEKGYADTGGHEIRITEANKVAYEVKLEGGKVVVEEKDLTGETFEKIEGKRAFGETKSPYDKELGAPAHETTPETAPTVKQAPQAVLDEARTPEKIIPTEAVPTETVSAETTPAKTTPAEVKRPEPYEPDPNIRAMHEEAVRRELLEKYNQPGQVQDFSNLTAEEKNMILLSHPEFASDQYGLGTEKLLQVYEANQKDLSFLFGNNSTNVWEHLKNVPAKEVIDQTVGNDATVRMAKYLRVLANFSRIEPEATLTRTESTEQYVARALQKLASEEKLEIFQTSVRR